MIDARVYQGMVLKSHTFGAVQVRKIYTHAETGETCLDCKSELGDSMHLSMRYVVGLIDAGRVA